MEQIAITTQYDMESRKKLVRYFAGMSGGDREALSPAAKKGGEFLSNKPSTNLGWGRNSR